MTASTTRVSAPDARLTIRPALGWVVGSVSAIVLVIYAVALSFHLQTDFEVYRTGGQHVFGTGLYAPRIKVPTDKLFTYPPLAAMAFWPIAHLSKWSGQLVWDLANIGFLAALLAVSSAGAQRRSLTGADWRMALMALAPVGILLWPVRLGFGLGQINVILVLMIVADLTMDLSWRGRRLPRGILVGLAAAAKLTPLVFVPYLLLTRQWQSARNAVVTFLVATGAMVALAPSASWAYFSKYMLDVSRIGKSAIPANQTIRAAFGRMGLGGAHDFVDLLIIAVLCAGLVLAAVAFHRSSPMLGALLCAATGLLVSPISWSHHYVWCVPLLVWLVVGVDRPRRGGLWAIPVALTFVLGPRGVGPAPFPDLTANLYVFATVALMGLAAWMLRARRSEWASIDPAGPDAVGTGARVIA